MIVITLTLLLAIVGLFYLYLTWTFDYWKKRGVAGPKPVALLGNYPNSLSQKRHLAEDLDDYYRKYKNDHNFIGIFNCRTPQLLITNPQLIHRVHVNDFKHFHDNEASTFVDEKSDFILANNPFTLTGERWKQRRAEVTPGITLARVKAAFPVTLKICKVMSQYIKKKIRVPPKDGLDGRDLSLRFTSQVVSDCVLGLNAESFSEQPTPIMNMASELFDKSFSFILVYMFLMGIFPFLRHFYKGRFVPKPVETFFVELMQKAINLRKSQKDLNERQDFLNYMLALQEKKNFDTLQLTAHTMTFLLDGYDTTGTVLSHCLLALGRYPEAQEKLRAEIYEHLGKGDDIDFDKMIDLPYLDACVHEAIRVIPPAFFFNKICTEPIALNDKNGNVLQVNKGDVVILPLSSVLLDEDYYPNAHEFQPERFLPENGGVKKYREQGLFMGFGDGPRACLGMRFALVQIKAALVSLLRDFNVRVNPKTRKDNKMSPSSFLARLEGGMWLDFEERN